MRKFISILIAVVMLIASIICFSGCSCMENCLGTLIPGADLCFKYGPEMEQGDFMYCYINSADQNHGSYKANAKYIAIIGLTEEGEKKKTLVIPEKIEDMDVILIGMRGLAWFEYLGGTYKKIYLPTTLQQVRDHDDLDEKNFLINLPNEEFFKNITHRFYVPEPKYEEFCAYAQNLNEKYIEYNWLSIANLTYIVDEEVYWIDDYDEGEQIVFPEEPKKEGFTFEGWYKEPEYINEWNVEEDVYTKDESLNTVNLYAKFEIV